jgi:hypothetical protein
MKKRKIVKKPLIFFRKYGKKKMHPLHRNVITLPTLWKTTLIQAGLMVVLGLLNDFIVNYRENFEFDFSAAGNKFAFNLFPVSTVSFWLCFVFNIVVAGFLIPSIFFLLKIYWGTPPAPNFEEKSFFNFLYVLNRRCGGWVFLLINEQWLQYGFFPNEFINSPLFMLLISGLLIICILCEALHYIFRWEPCQQVLNVISYFEIKYGFYFVPFLCYVMMLQMFTRFILADLTKILLPEFYFSMMLMCLSIFVIYFFWPKK